MQALSPLYPIPDFHILQICLFSFRCPHLLYLFGIHVFRRFLECLFVHDFSDRHMSFFTHSCGRMIRLFFSFSSNFSYQSYHIWIYPNLHIFDSLVFFFFHRMECLGLSYYIFMPLTLLTVQEPVELRYPRAFVGIFFFLVGNLVQFRCHMILANLRNSSRTSEAINGKYFLPQGFWFELVSSPHYFAEILIYLGLNIVSGGGSLAMW